MCPCQGRSVTFYPMVEGLKIPTKKSSKLLKEERREMQPTLI